jgi:hypothetical protein
VLTLGSKPDILRKPYGSEVKMTVTATFRYEAVRFSPIHAEQYPFQVVATSEAFPFFGVVELTLEEAQDLHKSLGMMIKGVVDG